MSLPPLGHLCGFQVLLPVNSTTVVMGAQTTPWHSGFNSFGYNSYVSSCQCFKDCDRWEVISHCDLNYLHATVSTANNNTLHICMCIAFACVFTRMYRHAHSTGMCGSQDTFFGCFSILSLWDKISHWIYRLLFGLPWLLRGPQGSSLSLSSIYKVLGTHCYTGFYMTAGHLNSGCHAWTAGIMPTDQSPQPF